MSQPDERPSFGRKAIASINKRLPDGSPGDDVPKMGPPDEMVAFATFIPRDLYLELLERKYWEPGFNIWTAVAEGIRGYLDAMGSPRKPLPPAYLAQLMKKNKKLKG
jgi:hypothetical protein